MPPHIRGYIDGDGSISFPANGYLEVIIHSASAFFLDFIRKEFNKVYPNGTKVTPSHHTWCLHYGSQTALNLIRYTYKGASLGLPRKMELAKKAFRVCSKTGAFK
jgi:hypothetical protein